MSTISYIVEHFPVRKTKTQKEKFREWALQYASQTGYKATVEENGWSKHKNVVIGDPEHASVIFTAHYDTCATIGVPNIMFPKNVGAFALYQLMIILIMIVVALIIPMPVLFIKGSANIYVDLCLAVYFAQLILMIFGKANVNNANDNSSGVACVMDTMQQIAEKCGENKSLAAFILFDNEEKGKLGSKAYAKAHAQQQYMKLVVNLDCIGNGENICAASSKMAKQRPEFAPLSRILVEHASQYSLNVVSASCALLNSDQASFKCGAIICACKRKKIIGYYTPYIHTKKDTVVDVKNIEYLTGCFTELISGFSK